MGHFEAMAPKTRNFPKHMVLPGETPARRPTVEDSLRAYEQHRAGLTPEQAAILKEACLGRCLFFTGPAGTGKSYLIERIIKALRDTLRQEVYVTAPTGVAAQNIRGQTLNSVTGIGLGEGTLSELEQKVRRNRNSMMRWQTMNTLIIDEISMVKASLFDILEQLGRTFRLTQDNGDDPWGGIQVIASGDFCQIPPVVQGNRIQCDEELAFQADSWNRTFPSDRCFLLTRVLRQKEVEFATALNEMRRGIVSEKAERMINARQAATMERIKHATGDWLKLPPDIINRINMGEEVPEKELFCPLQLYPKRANVEQVNADALDRLPYPEVCFEAVDTGGRDVEHRQNLLRDSLFTPEVTLRIGAQVMLLKNISVEEGLVNGTVGIVRAFLHPPCRAVAGSAQALQTGLQMFPRVDRVSLGTVMQYINNKRSTAQGLLAQLDQPTAPGLPAPPKEYVDRKRAVLTKLIQDAETLSAALQQGSLRNGMDPRIRGNNSANTPLQVAGGAIHGGASPMELLGNSFVVVEFNGRLTPIFADKLDVMQGTRTLATRYQIPLALAYATTIHKAQGKTLNDVFIDLNGIFSDCPAQGYVAISRVQRLEGLWIVGFHPESIRASARALSFYDKIARMTPAVDADPQLPEASAGAGQPRQPPAPLTQSLPPPVSAPTSAPPIPSLPPPPHPPPQVPLLPANQINTSIKEQSEPIFYRLGQREPPQLKKLHPSTELPPPPPVRHPPPLPPNSGVGPIIGSELETKAARDADQQAAAIIEQRYGSTAARFIPAVRQAARQRQMEYTLASAPQWVRPTLASSKS